MNTTMENLAFIIVRGIMALAIIALGFYCITQGIHFFELSRSEAEQIHIHLIGLDITASGMGAIIFGTGIALCFVGKQTGPKMFQWKQTSTAEPSRMPEIAGAPKNPLKAEASIISSPFVVRTEEILTIARAPQAEDKFTNPEDLL